MVSIKSNVHTSKRTIFFFICYGILLIHWINWLYTKNKLIDLFSIKICILLIFLSTKYRIFMQLAKKPLSIIWVSQVFHKWYVNNHIAPPPLHSNTYIGIYIGDGMNVRRVVNTGFNPLPLSSQIARQYTMFYL